MTRTTHTSNRRFSRLRTVLRTVTLLGCVVAAVAHAADVESTNHSSTNHSSTDHSSTDYSLAIETNVGMEGVYYARVRGATLEAKPVDDEAPVVLRIADVVQDGDSTIYELRYIGSLPGDYDLRDYLMRVDGQPLAGVEPMQVVVRGLLPEDHDGSLETFARPAAEKPLAYRTLLVVVAVLWLLLPAWLLIRSWSRPRERPQLRENGRPTLADQLQPLVEAAVAGRVTSHEKARLERLLIVHWRRRLDLNGCSAVESLRRLRQHPDSGELLQELDKWLHQPPDTARVDVAEILQPYRAAAPIDEEELLDNAEVRSGNAE